MRFIELFAGIGGFRYGLEKANDTITEGIQQRIGQREKNNTTNIKPRLGAKQFNCVWANEIDKYACQIYRKNYGKRELYEGDIRGISTETIPDHDLLTAGFPCQAFSIAGRRKGFNDTRGTLFFEICRIAKIKRPNILLLENVKGLLNHQKGETFRIILDSLSELGYDCEWQVHNSKSFGVPQNRERVFIIGHFRRRTRCQIFPLREDAEISNKKNETDQRPSQTEYSTTLRGAEIKADHTFIIKKAKSITPKTRAGDTYVIQDKRQNREFRYYKEIIPTVSKHWGTGGGNVPLIYKIRRLTPTECERLQGFPDGWTEGLSDSQRYKCLGNAVTTNIITEIGKAIIR